jgi:hypothetical protein
VAADLTITTYVRTVIAGAVDPAADAGVAEDVVEVVAVFEKEAEVCIVVVGVPLAPVEVDAACHARVQVHARLFMQVDASAHARNVADTETALRFA